MERDNQITGGTAEVIDANEDTRKITDLLRPLVEETVNKKFESFEPTKTLTQVVAGINHFIKVKVSPSEFVHLRIYQNLCQELSLHGILEGKSEEDVLEYFDQNTFDKPPVSMLNY